MDSTPASGADQGDKPATTNGSATTSKEESKPTDVYGKTAKNGQENCLAGGEKNEASTNGDGQRKNEGDEEQDAMPYRDGVKFEEVIREMRCRCNYFTNLMLYSYSF